MPIVPLVLDLLGTTQQTSPPSCDETSLLTSHGVAVDGRGFTNVLVVTLLLKCVSSAPCWEGPVSLTPP